MSFYKDEIERANRLERIEAKLDRIIEMMGRLLDALSQDDEEDEGTDLDGRPMPAQRREFEPL